MAAGQNAKTAGIIRDRFVKSELGRKIGDRFLDRSARSSFAVGVLAREIVSKCVVDLLELAKKSFVLREFFQSRLSRHLQHPDGIVIRPIPEVWIEVSKKSPRSRFPGPPKIERDLSQRFEGCRKGRNDIINL